ncbi:MAG: hypothetical protein WC725_01905 [Patescibacteria group bacterium]|jgi:hypothetical protein
MKNSQYDQVKSFFLHDVLKRDFLLPLRLLLLVYVIYSFFAPVGWTFLKTTIFLLASSFFHSAASEGVSTFSLVFIWWLYAIDLVVVGTLFYYFIKLLNQQKGIKKLLSLIPVAGLILFMFTLVLIFAFTDKLLPGLNLFSTLSAIDKFFN